MINPPQRPTASSPYVSCLYYDWGVAKPNGFSLNSSRGYGYRNCTDWVAFRVNQASEGKISVSVGLGNAKDWYANSPTGQQALTPKAGDIAVSTTGTYGHVAFVEWVSPDGSSMIISEYNHDEDGHGDQRQVAVSGSEFTKFIDLGVHLSWAEDQPKTNPYAPENITVMPNVNGALSVFVANEAGLMAYKDQSYPGEDLKTKAWGSITEHLMGQPDIVAYPNGAMTVFGHGADARLHMAWQTGPGTAWSGDISPWDMSLRGDPSAVLNYTGGVSVFVPDSNGNMREIDQIGQGNDMGTAPVHNLGGNLQGKPAVMNIDGKVVLFAHGADGNLYTDFQSAVGGSWSGWESIGGEGILGDPKTIVNRLGGLTVLAIGADGTIVGIDQTYKGESMNKPFYTLSKPAGVNFAGTPAITQTQNGEQMVFAVASTGTLYHKAQVQANQYNWTDFFNLNGNLIGVPTVTRNSAGGASIFGRNPDGTVITLDQPGYGAAFNTQWVGLNKP